MAFADRTSLLERPASILAENDTHAVVAVRVPKAWVSENLLFLAALADIAGGPADRQALKSLVPGRD